MQLPIEIFSIAIGLSVALGIFGFIRNPQIPAMMAFAGIFILFIAITTDQLKMGNLVSQSIFNSTSNITDYSYNDDIFQFTELPKTIFALLGSIFMLAGGLMIFANKE
jgi:hypothetical protein